MFLVSVLARSLAPVLGNTPMAVVCVCKELESLLLSGRTPHLSQHCVNSVHGLQLLQFLMSNYRLHLIFHGQYGGELGDLHNAQESVIPRENAQLFTR